MTFEFLLAVLRPGPFVNGDSAVLNRLVARFSFS
jgi:hypothetical protein